MLTSVVHRVPRARPFGLLVWTLRLVMALLLARYAWRLQMLWHHPCHGEADDA